MLCFAVLLLTVHSAISMSEMEAVLKKVETLESGYKATQIELAGVKDELAHSKLTIQKLEKRANTAVAFSVTTNQALTVGDNTKFTFNVIHTNVGGGWNVGTSEFACPISGYYAFSITTLSLRDASSNARVVVGSATSANAYSSNQSGNGALTHVALCNAGEVVQMRCVGNCRINGSTHTAFSGFLIAAA